MLCRVMQVSKSGYFAWQSRPESDRSKQNNQLVEKIRKIHKDSHASYGSPRIHVELKEQKVSCSLNRVARLMRLEGITAKQKRQFIRTTEGLLGNRGSITFSRYCPLLFLAVFIG